MAIVALHFRQHSCGRHLRLDRTRGERHLGELANDQGLQSRRSEQLFRLRIERREVERDEDFGLAVFDFKLERAQRVQGRIVDDRAAGFQHAEEGDDVMGRVGHEDADVHARPNTELLKSRGGAVRERVQFRIGYLLVHELQRGERAKSLGGRLEDALHRREFERRVPAHARRIGLDPRLDIHRLSSRSPAPSCRPAHMTADVWSLNWPIRRRTVKQPRCESGLGDQASAQTFAGANPRHPKPAWRQTSMPTFDSASALPPFQALGRSRERHWPSWPAAHRETHTTAALCKTIQILRTRRPSRASRGVFGLFSFCAAFRPKGGRGRSLRFPLSSPSVPRPH